MSTKCTGTTLPACANCMRRSMYWALGPTKEPYFAMPPINYMTGSCDKQMAPAWIISDRTTSAT